MKQIENRLKELLYECNQHKKRVTFVRKKLKPIIPLNQNKYSNLSEEYISFIDQLIFRFSKLQDTMREKLL